MAEIPLGRLVVVSGPSGAGKTTVLRQVFACAVPLVRSVSATTRAPRPGEADGQAYHFLTPADFQTRRLRGEFLECFEVFGEGHWYGTLENAVAAGLQAGKWVLLEIDVQGALAVVDKYPDAITVFLRPPSLEVLEKRLRGRRTESEEAIQRRLARPEQNWRWPIATPTRWSTKRATNSGRPKRFVRFSNANRGPTVMLDELKEEAIVKKVGGRIQALDADPEAAGRLEPGLPVLIEMSTDDKMRIVIQEILQDKIYLDTESNVRVAGDRGAGGPPEMDFNQL